MNALSPELISELQSIPWFQRLSPEHFERLAGLAQIRDVAAGEVLFREGGREDFVYIVLAGRVALDIFVPGRGRVRILTVEPMEVVGWSSVTPVVRQRLATATAVLPSRLAGFDGGQLRALCEDDHDFGYQLMHRMSNIIAGRLMTTRLQLLDMFAQPAEVGHD
jgi:CRP-like cAMP-binding protein